MQQLQDTHVNWSELEDTHVILLGVLKVSGHP